MDIDQLIVKLKESGLCGECPGGYGDFKLSNAVLFDGTKPFPEVALGIQLQLQAQLTEQGNELRKKKKRATETAAITTEAVNVGKNLEKILPTMSDFKWSVPDCKFLGDPIDLLVFNGLAFNKVTSIGFVEVKSGNARLNKHQKSIKDAIEDERVSYRVFT
jgi:predicted Holliday junction resolvase-like endonuclease